MAADSLIEALESLEPVELEGVELLRRLRAQTGVWFPTSESGLVTREEMIRATAQLVAFGQASRELAEKLDDLAPEPLDVPLVEYSL